LLALNPRRADFYSSELVLRYVIQAAHPRDRVTSLRVPAARAYSLGSDRPDGPRFGRAPRIGVLRDGPFSQAGRASQGLTGMSCHPTGQWNSRGRESLLNTKHQADERIRTSKEGTKLATALRGLPGLAPGAGTSSTSGGRGPRKSDSTFRALAKIRLGTTQIHGTQVRWLMCRIVGQSRWGSAPGRLPRPDRRCRVGAEVATRDEQLVAQDGPETGHRLDGHRLMGATSQRSAGRDLEALVELKKARG
jgi:hypothetical protein